MALNPLPGVLPRALLLVTLMSLSWSCTPGSETRPFEQSQRGLQVCPGPDTLEGIDVSYWQGTIDWDSVAAAGIQFAFIRVSDGLNYPDTQFDYNWTEAARVGITRGAYQYFRPNQNPIDQADYLINTMGPLASGDLPPVIDVETDGGESPSVVADRVQQWLDHVEAAVGRRPIIYTAMYFWQSSVGTGNWDLYPLWAANWGVTCPNIPSPWTEWVFHQYTDSGSVSGISGNVDMNVFNGDLAALDAFTNVQPVCGDGVCNGTEDNASCPQDCPICEPIPPGGRIVDQDDICVELGGTQAYFHPESDGFDNDLLWTYTVDANMDNNVTWNLHFDAGGDYLLEAYTDADWAESQMAKYQVHHAGGTDVVEVDQSAIDGWNPIGEFTFSSSEAGWVRLEDLTGEPYSTQTRIVFDALRVSPITPPEPDAGVRADAQIIEDAGAFDDGAIPSDGSPLPDGGTDDDAASAPDGASSERDGGKADGDHFTSGCGCRTLHRSNDAPLPVLSLFAIVMVLGWRRRKRT